MGKYIGILTGQSNNFNMLGILICRIKIHNNNTNIEMVIKLICFNFIIFSDIY